MSVPSDFLHTTIEPKDPKVHLALQGKLAEIMVKVDTKIYRKLVITDSKGNMLLYVEMKKAFYRMIKSALLFYMKMVGHLIISGFKINPYNPCVRKMFLGGEHITAVLHVDDIKVLHKRNKAITEVV